MSMTDDPELAIKLKRLEVKGQIFGTLIPWSGLVFITGFLCLATYFLAGKETDANIFFKFITDWRISEGLAWVITGGSIFWCKRQSSLNKREKKHLLEEKTKLQRFIDSQLTSNDQAETDEHTDEHSEDEI